MKRAVQIISSFRKVSRALILHPRRTIVAVGLAILCYYAYRASKAAKDLHLMLTEKRDRSLRALITSLRQRVVERQIFLPLEPSGVEKDDAWTTNSRADLMRTTSGSTTNSSPIDDIGNEITIGITKWRTSATRIDRKYVNLRLEFIGYCWPHPYSRPPAQGSWYVRREFSQGTLWLAGTRCNEYRSFTIDDTSSAVISSVLRVNGKKTQPYSIATLLKSTTKDTPEEVTVKSSLLADYWAEQWPVTPVRTTTPPQILQFVGDSRDDILAPFKTTGIIAGPVMTENPDRAPLTGYQNDLVAIHARLDKVRNNKLEIPEQYLDYAEEFAEQVSRDLAPLSIDDVIESQDRPLQKLRNAMDSCFVTIKTLPIQVKAMLKKEAISNMGPTRNISTMPTETNLKIARYTLALSNHLKKNTRWYCAGKPPTEVAELIVDLVEGMDSCMAADISKMDACKNVTITVHLLTRIFERMFHDEEIKELMEAEILCTAKTSTGIPYVPTGSQLSGSSTTTNHNTITNAWLSYCADRIRGFTPLQAYCNLGLFVGDDSLSQNTPETVDKVASDLGYVIVPEMIQKGDEIPFLSRYFPDAWEGGLGSYQDPIRLAKKMHISFSDPAQGQRQIALNKWHGLADLDPANSFYVATYNKLQLITGLRPKFNIEDLGYLHRSYLEEGYAGWPQTNADDYFERRTGVPVTRLIDWLQGVKSFDEWMGGPGFTIDAPKKCKYGGVDPTDAFSQPPEVSTNQPPEFATAGTDPKTAENRTVITNRISEAYRRETRKLKKLRKKEAGKKSKSEADEASIKGDIFSDMQVFDSSV